MSRYGAWGSSWGSGWGSPWGTRPTLSPMTSQTDTQGNPVVTDDDFSYITSQDLEGSLSSPQRAFDPPGRHAPTEGLVEDDVLLVKNKGVIHPVNFPAFSIGDGKLTVRDVRDRIGLVMEITDPRKQKQIKMLYKGKQLKDLSLPIREYRVKNNSEIMVVMPEGGVSDDSDESSEEVIVADPEEEPQKQSKSKKKNRNKKKKKVRSPGDSTTLEVPDTEDYRLPSRAPSPGTVTGPVEKLQLIDNHFTTTLLPLCLEFTANPPADSKKVLDEHRKLSETVLQQVLLKLDEVDTGGDPEIRAKRKALVHKVQETLNGIDKHLPAGASKPSLY